MTIVWTGLAVGSVYALIAIAYNVGLAQSGYFNFAQPTIMIFGNFFAWWTMAQHGWPWWAASLVGGVVCGAIGLAEELIAIRPITRNPGSHGSLITTVGASVVITGLLLASWAKTPKFLPFFGGKKAFTFFGGRLDPVDVWLVGLAIAFTVVMTLVSRYTSWGLGGRAANSDPEAAKAKGVNVTMLRTSAFVLAGAMGGLLGPFLAPKVGLDTTLGISLTIFGFIGLAIGGFGSYPGCLVGGLAVGMVQAYTARYFGSEYPPLILFVVLLGVLLLKPTGLLGRRALRVV